MPKTLRDVRPTAVAAPAPRKLRDPVFAGRNKAIATALLRGASTSQMANQYGLSPRRCSMIFRSMICRTKPELRALSITAVRESGQAEEVCALIAQIPDEEGITGKPFEKSLPSFGDVCGNPPLAPTERMKKRSVLERRIRRAERQDFEKPLTKEERVRLIDRTTRAAFFFLDDATLAVMPGKELATVINTLLTQRQLAAGEPTAILSHAEREKIDKLAPRVLAECQRRGIVIEAVKTEYALVPEDKK